MINQKDLYNKAQNDLKEIELSIIELLSDYPQGLTNTDIATMLGLSSSHEGG
ncbi:MAG TPA: winged helix-turn-helix transcriptional regulator [Treponemataceae bacterium]|nr:winged helix-turn-helix transcriptional regulator [Treponemataceae bacterium]